jgi:hypothetical protein
MAWPGKNQDCAVVGGSGKDETAPLQVHGIMVFNTGLFSFPKDRAIPLSARNSPVQETFSWNER